MAPALRRLYEPRPARVVVGPSGSAHAGGAPREVDGVAVAAVREEWAVADRWWTSRPLRRHYFELALADGHAVVVFRSSPDGRWYRQRA